MPFIHCSSLYVSISSVKVADSEYIERVRSPFVRKDLSTKSDSTTAAILSGLKLYCFSFFPVEVVVAALAMLEEGFPINMVDDTAKSDFVMKSERVVDFVSVSVISWSERLEFNFVADLLTLDGVKTNAPQDDDSDARIRYLINR